MGLQNLSKTLPDYVSVYLLCFPKLLYLATLSATIFFRIGIYLRGNYFGPQFLKTEISLFIKEIRHDMGRILFLLSIRERRGFNYITFILIDFA